MGLLGRVWQVVRSNIQNLVDETEDPESVLEASIENVEQNLVGIRRAIAHAIALQKRTERQLKAYQTQAESWYRRAELALTQQQEGLAREALTRRLPYLQQVDFLHKQVQAQQENIAQLKGQMRLVEVKLSEMKIKKDLYIARIKSAIATQKLQDVIYNFSESTAGIALEKVEKKLWELEAEAELNSDPLEEKFRSLSASQDIEAQLTQIKSRTQLQPPLTSDSNDIEQLRAEIEQI